MSLQYAHCGPVRAILITKCGARQELMIPELTSVHNIAIVTTPSWGSGRLEPVWAACYEKRRFALYRHWNTPYGITAEYLEQ